jgi:hypothetical protein
LRAVPVEFRPGDALPALELVLEIRLPLPAGPRA